MKRKLLIPFISLLSITTFAISCNNQNKTDIVENKLLEFSEKVDKFDLNYDYKSKYNELLELTKNNNELEKKLIQKSNELVEQTSKLINKYQENINNFENLLTNESEIQKINELREKFGSLIIKDEQKNNVSKLNTSFTTFLKFKNLWGVEFPKIKDIKDMDGLCKFLEIITSKFSDFNEQYNNYIYTKIYSLIPYSLFLENNDNNINKIKKEIDLVNTSEKSPYELLKEKLSNHSFITLENLTQIESSIFNKYKDLLLGENPNIKILLTKYNDWFAIEENQNQDYLKEFKNTLYKIDIKTLSENDSFLYVTFLHFVLEQNLKLYERIDIKNHIKLENNDEFTRWSDIKHNNIKINEDEREIFFINEIISNYEDIEPKPTKFWKEAAWRKRMNEFSNCYGDIVIKNLNSFVSKFPEVFYEDENLIKLISNDNLLKNVWTSHNANIGDFLSNNGFKNKALNEIYKVFGKEENPKFDKFVSIDGVDKSFTAIKVLDEKKINDKTLRLRNIDGNNFDFDKNKFKIIIKERDIKESNDIKNALEISFTIEFKGIKSKIYNVILEDLKGVVPESEYHKIIDKEIKKLEQNKLRVKIKDLDENNIPKFLNEFSYSKFIQIEEEILPNQWVEYNFPFNFINDLVSNYKANVLKISISTINKDNIENLFNEINSCKNLELKVKNNNDWIKYDTTKVLSDSEKDDFLSKLNANEIKIELLASNDIVSAHSLVNIINYSKFIIFEEKINDNWNKFVINDILNNLRFSTFINRGTGLINGDEENVNITFSWQYTRSANPNLEDWNKDIRIKKVEFDLKLVREKIKNKNLKDIEKLLQEAENSITDPHTTISIIQPLYLKAMNAIKSLPDNDYALEKVEFNKRLEKVKLKLDDPNLKEIDKVDKAVKDLIKYSKNKYADTTKLKEKYTNTTNLINQLNDTYFKNKFTNDIKDVKENLENKEAIQKVYDYINTNFNNLTTTKNTDSFPMEISYYDTDDSKTLTKFIEDVNRLDLLKAHEAVSVNDIKYKINEYDGRFYNRNGYKTIGLIISKGNDSMEIQLKISGFKK
ncbi:hypothetical protein [Mycoplasma elephantis]|uniref:hypothetical protein n=1 Tax=Mycoplasma elephantis TaxID=114882 RepID=UPI000480A44F|nr:hypothetical protein [Mycoplasma elephantis]